MLHHYHVVPNESRNTVLTAFANQRGEDKLVFFGRLTGAPWHELEHQIAVNMKTQTTIWNAVALLFVTIAILTFQSPASAVEFETIRSNMNNMTSAAWDDYSTSLEGQSVSWTGWISDVEKQWFGGFKILIDMDLPGSASVQDVYIEDLEESFATQFGSVALILLTTTHSGSS